MPGTRAQSFGHIILENPLVESSFFFVGHQTGPSSEKPNISWVLCQEVLSFWVAGGSKNALFWSAHQCINQHLPGRGVGMCLLSFTGFFCSFFPCFCIAVCNRAVCCDIWISHSFFFFLFFFFNKLFFMQEMFSLHLNSPFHLKPQNPQNCPDK